MKVEVTACEITAIYQYIFINVATLQSEQQIGYFKGLGIKWKVVPLRSRSAKANRISK